MQKSVSKYLAIASVLATISVANAEKSGAFVGLEAGVNVGTLEAETGSYALAKKTTQYLLGGSYGFIAGYKQFFTSHIGLRYYANLNLKHSTKDITNSTGESYIPDFIWLNYGANVDFLGNFVSNEDLDFGGFVGLGIGANTEFISQRDSTTNLDVALNVGLRTTFDSKHSLELISRVPFLPTTKGNERATKLIYREPVYDYSVSLRYAYSF